MLNLYVTGLVAGINLLQVAAHEFGHALGLRHSDIQGALMYPFYQGYVEDYTLPYDDIAGIQAIYGGRPDEPTTRRPRPTTTTASTTPSTPTTTPSTPEPVDPGMPDMCEDGRFDAITAQYINGRLVTHVFSGAYYMQIDRQGIVDGFPHLISRDWPGIHSVDAALTPEYDYHNGQWMFRMVRVQAHTST